MLLSMAFSQLFKERSDQDFVRRTRSGVLIYVVAYPLLIFSTDVYHQSVYFCVTLFILMTSIAIARLLLAQLLSKPFYHQHQKFWRYLILGFSLAHGICWSVIFIKFVADPRFENVSFTMLLGLVAIVSGSTNTLIPKGNFFHLYVAILMAPMLLMLFIRGFHLSLILVMLCFWIYSYFLGNQIYNEYVNSFRSEYEAGKNKEALEALSKTDSLTGIFNRHHFNESVEQQWHMCMRNRYPLSLIMMDVDHFKRINDTHGHILGDDCLVHVAAIVRNVVKRSTDIVTRYGGEEFAIILPGTSAAHACEVAEKIRQEVENTPFVSNHHILPVTVSCGVSSHVPDETSSVLELLANADTALYLAKNTGRNRVESHINNYPGMDDGNTHGTQRDDL